ncbi:putative Ig domain-containing protein [Aurantimonas sp. MSK8Z-1]|uniref:putative Ig domain-containing protein n=1 Tax=Mangrovibrevibacter kandeliae TaxID=2968473 RepID=UPI002118DD59|nr:putative Ig domain-containing protein [Aurantimonas sp. MSK8Z-1]MCW4115491.1 putative Ig domain-containing protein [Aurantimonas sp. MSK8Z-1]
MSSKTGAWMRASGVVRVAAAVLILGWTMLAASSAVFAAGGGDLLSNLTISSGTLNPGFDPGTTNYTASVAPSVATVLVTPTAGDAQASLKVNGATAISGAPRSVALSFGPNPIQVLVTSGDGSNTSRTYGIVVTRASPTITLSPATLPGGMIAQAYSATISASGGTAPYGFSATGLPAGLTLGTGGALSGTPTTAGSFTATVTATDANGATGVSSYSLTIAAPVTLAPATLPGGMIGQAYSATISASGGTAPYRFSATGVPTGLTLSTGGALSGTPTTAGGFTVAVTATDANGATGTHSYSLTIMSAAQPLALSPAGGRLSDGTVGRAYSQTITASGGVPPYSFSASGLPQGLSLDASSGAITGTPATAGSYGVVIEVRDAQGATASGSYSLVIAAAPTAFVFSPPSGALPQAMAGEAYSQPIAAAGGTGPKLYGVASGTLPRGLVLNVSTGTLNGPLNAGTEGDYSFTIAVTDGSGATATAAYTLKVVAQQIAVADKSETVVAGESPADVYLNAGATGGPFTSAAIAYVEPPQAGVARITEGAVAALGPVAPKGFYLTFIPSAEFSGTAKVGYTLTSALGTSNVGIVTYVVELDARAVADKADRLVRDFVSARQSLLANTVETPGLIERRMAATSTQMGSLGLAPSGDGLSVDFATSTAQIEAARRHALGDTGETAPMPRFNAWASASVLAHKQGDSDDGGKDGGWGDFTLVSFGADYLVTDRLLLGLALHTDHTSDPSDDGDVHGTGFLFGPYASLELSPSLYLDASLYYGRSWNTVDLGTFEGDFDTTRYMATTKLEGILGFGALTLRPNLKLSYIDESVDDYAVGNDAGESVAVAGFSEQHLRFSAGAKASYALPLDNGWTLTPTFGGSIGVSSGNGGALDDAIGEGLFGTVEAGFGLAGGEGWSLLAAGTLNLEGKGNTAIGGKASLAIPF